MSACFSETALEEDLAEVRTLPMASRWKIEKVGPLEVIVALSSSRADAEVFEARLLWRTYPDDAPSLKFREPKTGRLDQPTAWPVVRGFRPTSLDACVNYCAEGFHLHPEWRSDPEKRWDVRGNRLLYVVSTLQDELDHHFAGRFRS